MFSLNKESYDLFRVGTLYQVLDVDKGASQDEIHKAYLKRSLEVHPDKTQNVSNKDKQKKQFQLLTKIYQLLMDDKSRREYDETMECHNNGSMIVESEICDEIILNDCNENDKTYYYECRCSGKFILDKQEIKTSYRYSRNHVFILDCDSCSSSIKLILN